MRAYTIIKFGTVAIKAEGLKPFLGKAILAQPTIEGATSTDRTAMLSTVIIDMVNSQHISLRLSTTNALTTVGSEGFLAKLHIPNLDIVFLTRLTTDTFTPVAVRTEQLKVFLGKVILAKPPVETVPIASYPAMVSTIIADMVNRKKSGIRLTTNRAFTAISRKNLIAESITIPLMLHTATFANGMTCFSRANNTRATHTSLPFIRSTLAIILIQMGTYYLLLFRRFRKQGFTPFLNDFLIAFWMSKIVITAASFTDTAQTIFSTTKLTKVVRREVLFAIRTKLLITTEVRVLRYTITHGKGYSFSSRLGMFAASLRHHYDFCASILS